MNADVAIAGTRPVARSPGRVQTAQAVREPPTPYVAFTLSNNSTTGCAGGGVSSVTPMAEAIEMRRRALPAECPTRRPDRRSGTATTLLPASQPQLPFQRPRALNLRQYRPRIITGPNAAPIPPHA